MRRLAVLGAVLALVASGCGDGDGDTTSAGGAAGGTSGTGGAGASTTMAEQHLDHVGNPTSTCSPGGAALTITARDTRFDKDCLAAPASQAFTLTLDNRDPLPHNIAVLESHAATDVLFRIEISAGPQSTTMNVPALRPGTYAFHCEVHPARMSGTFLVR